MFLEDDVTVCVLSEIEEQFLNFVAEVDIVGVFSHVVEPSIDFIDDAIGVFLVSILEEVLSSLLKMVPFLSRLILNNISFLLQALADESINVTPPSIEFGIVVGINDEIVDSVKNVIHGGAVREVLEKGLELMLSLFEVGVASGALRFNLGVFGDILRMAGVFLGETNEGIDGISVVVMLLNLNNHLLQAIDSLIAALRVDFLLEIFLGLLLIGIFDILGLFLVLIGDLFGDALLGGRETSVSAGLLINVAAGGLVGVLVRGSSGGDLRVRLTGRALCGVLLNGISVILRSIGCALPFLFSLIFHLTERRRGIMPLVIRGRFVDLIEPILVGTKRPCSVAGGIGSHVTTQENGVFEQFTELTVGDEKTAQGAQSVQGVLTMLLSLVFADGDVNVGRIGRRGGLNGVPQEVLQFFVVVLLEPEPFC